MLELTSLPVLDAHSVLVSVLHICATALSLVSTTVGGIQEDLENDGIFDDEFNNILELLGEEVRLIMIDYIGCYL